MKKFILIILGFVAFSCDNDIKIITSNDNKECRRLVTCFKYDKYLNEAVGRETDSVSGNTTFVSPNIDKERVEYSKFYNNMDIFDVSNISYLSFTKSLSIKNFSKTKVYNVRIQRTYQEKVKFKDYKVEPTEEICIGCVSDFDLKLDYLQTKVIETYPYSGESIKYILPYEGKVKRVYKVEYKVHSVKQISEY